MAVFLPFASFPVPHIGARRRDPQRDYQMEWLGWPGRDYTAAPDEAAPADEPDSKPPRDSH